jgi:hypothetical protein
VKVKNVSGQTVRCEWVPGGYVDDGATVDVPEEQPDGSPLIWHPDIWEPVKAKKPVPADVKE